MSFLGKIFKKKDKFSLDSDSDPFKDMSHDEHLGSSDSSFSTDPSATQSSEDFGHGTFRQSSEFTQAGLGAMQQSPPQYAPPQHQESSGYANVPDLLQRDMQIINAKLDAIKANVEILSHKVESLEKATEEKKKNTYW